MSTRRKRRPRRAWREAHRNPSVEKLRRRLRASRPLPPGSGYAALAKARALLDIPPWPLKYDAATVILYDVPWKALPSTPSGEDLCEELLQDLTQNERYSIDV